MKNKHVLLTGSTGKIGLGVTPIVLAQGAIITVSRLEKEVNILKSEPIVKGSGIIER